MNTLDLSINSAQLQKLLATASGDVALLYLYLHSGNELSTAGGALHLSDARLQCAAATLRQLGLWQPEREARVFSGERPHYSEEDVVRAMNTDGEFQGLYGEIQRLLGRSLNTEEMKIILGFVRYLGLSADVISVLVSYCKDRARQKGSLRNPSLRTIEKEAYAWAERGIDTMEEAAAFIQAQNLRNSRISRLMALLQIRGRTLTPGEEKYARAWLEMGFDEEAISMAFEKTCLNTGSLNWAYMNKILTRWHGAGLHTGQQIRTGDHKPGTAARPGKRQFDEDELAAIEGMFKEG